MSSFNRLTYLVANGGYPLKPAGIPIDVCPQDFCGNDECRYNAVPGELLIFDTETRKTIDVSMIPTVRKIAIAQAVGSNGCASDIKYLFNEKFDLCKHGFDLKVASPNCGQGQVLDVYLPNCTPSDLTFGFGVYLDDSWVRNNFGENEKLFYNWVVDNYKAGCTSCDDKAVCDELICKLVDRINGNHKPDPTKVVHGLRAGCENKYQPFRAARLYVGEKTTKKFCLSLTGDECNDCAYLPGITGISIDGKVTNFGFTVDPSDPSRTLPSQIDRIVKLMNDALKPIGGHAFRYNGLGKCCPYSIEINTCATTVEIVTAAGNIAPCEELDVKATKEAKVICRDCGDTPDPENLTCGIRLFVDPIEVDCNCLYPPNFPPPNTYIRTIEPTLSGDGYGSESITVIKVQDATHPEGFGYFYQDAATKASNGGPGNDWRYSDVGHGRYGLLDKGSRSSNIDVKCDATYCVWDFVPTYSEVGKVNNELRYHQKDWSRVMIESKYVPLITQWEEILTALKDRGLCGDIDVHCEI